MFFLHVFIKCMYMTSLPPALPRRFRDLRFCFRESNFRTAASVSFRGLDFPKIFPEVLPRSDGEHGRVVFELFGRRGIVGAMFLVACCWLTKGML